MSLHRSAGTAASKSTKSGPRHNINIPKKTPATKSTALPHLCMPQPLNFAGTSREYFSEADLKHKVLFV